MADFQGKAADFEQNGIGLYALSTDDQEHAREMADKHGLTFPVLYGVDGRELSRTWGAYYEENRGILHATAYILRPEHTIASATYSTGPVGRLTPGEALGIIQFYKSK